MAVPACRRVNNMIQTATASSTVSRGFLARETAGGGQRREAAPILTASRGQVRVKSAGNAGIMVCTYDLPAGHGLALGGPVKPGYLVHLVLCGSVRLMSACGAAQAIPSRAGFQLHRQGLSLTAPSAASGILVWIPASALNCESARYARKNASGPKSIQLLGLSGCHDSLENRLLCECLENLAGLINRNSPPDPVNRAARLLRVLLAESAAVNAGPDVQAAGQLVPGYVTAAESYAAERLADSLTMSSLAQAAGVSARTLQDGFRKFRGYSPMQYLREQRMLAVRRELLAPSHSTSVTDIALKWGMNHLGRFSAYYASQFGERPSETLRMARLGPVASSRAAASSH